MRLTKRNINMTLLEMKCYDEMHVVIAMAQAMYDNKCMHRINKRYIYHIFKASSMRKVHLFVEPPGKTNC